MSINEVLQSKVSHFWLLVRSIDQLKADDEYRLARASLVTNMKSDKINDYFSGLKDRINNNGFTVVDESRDEVGINRLKKLSSKPAM